MIDICLLGHPNVLRDGEPLKISRRKSRAILFYSAAQAQPVPRQALLELFWPDLPRTAAQQTLRTSLHGLRNELGAALQVDEQVIGIVSDVRVDVQEFSEKLDAAGSDIPNLVQALSLYRGDFLEGFILPDAGAFEDWMYFERDHLRQKAVNGFARLALLHADRGEFQQSLACLDRALSFNPLQEDLQRERIRIHFLSGDRPGAIQRYDELRKLLDQELGVPPMVETRRLYDAIINDRMPAASTAKPETARVQYREKQKPAGEIPFVGREKELQDLGQAVKDGKLVVAEGEAGIGKTRLVMEYISKSGALALVGAARELEHHLPYQPVFEAFRGLLNEPDWPSLSSKVKRQLSPVWLAETGRLLPELLEPGEAQITRGQQADEARLWEAARQFLSTLAGYRPVILFLDDLQWADAATLGLLAYLARTERQSKLLLIAASRQALPRTPLRSFLQSLARDNRLHRLGLSRLLSADIQTVAGSLSQKFAPPLADWLKRTSEGNPFILNELVRHARQAGFLQADGVLNLSGLSSAAQVPQSVYSLLQSRLERLSEPARRVLDAAVAAGRDFEYAIVSQVAGLSEQAALDALDELLDAGLIRPLQSSRFMIDHPLIIEVAYQEAGELRHRFLHRKVAEVIESAHQDALDGYAGSLAWHYYEGGDLPRASRFSQLAARSAVRLAAWNEAIEFYQLAMKDAEGGKSVDLWVELAQAYSKAGHFSQASDSYRKSLDLLVDDDKNSTKRVALQLGLARSLMPQSKFSQVIDLAQGVQAESGDENKINAELLWGTALSLEGADLKTALQHLSAAAVLWHQKPGGDTSTLAQIQFETGSVFAQMGDLDQAIDFYRQSLKAARMSSIPYAQDQVVLAHNNLAYHLHLAGDPAARDEALAGLDLAQANGVVGLQPYLFSTLGEIALADGDIPQAEQYFQQGLQMAVQFNLRERIAGLTANLGLAAQKRGEIEAAVEKFSQALKQAQALGTKHLAAQISIWLAPLLPAEQALLRLAAARAIAQESGRGLLLQQIEVLEEKIQRN